MGEGVRGKTLTAETRRNAEKRRGKEKWESRVRCSLISSVVIRGPKQNVEQRFWGFGGGSGLCDGVFVGTEGGAFGVE